MSDYCFSEEKGYGRREERGVEKKNCFGSNRVCHQPGCARQMDHEYCLDALCLSGAVVSKDKQWDAGLSDWGKSGRAPLSSDSGAGWSCPAEREERPRGCWEPLGTELGPDLAVVEGEGEGRCYGAIDFSRVCPGTAAWFSRECRCREGVGWESHQLAIKHMQKTPPSPVFIAWLSHSIRFKMLVYLLTFSWFGPLVRKDSSLIPAWGSVCPGLLR